DALGVESEIAKAVADALQIKLTGREKQALAVKPTNNADAYDAYLRGLACEGRYYSSFLEAGFMSGRYSLTPVLRSLGRDFVAWTRISTLPAPLLAPLGAIQRNVLRRTHRNWSRTLLRPCSRWVIISTRYCVITGLLRPPSSASARCCPAAAEFHMPSA